MAVKTKRSSVRTALLASASLAALAQGANAIGFTAEPTSANSAGAHAFANGVTPACAELIFDISTGGLVDYKTFAAGTASSYEKGRAVAITPGTETTFAHCKTAPGYYLHTVTTSAADGTGLKTDKAPAGWYAQGGGRLTDGAVLAKLAAAPLVVVTDETVRVIGSCAAGSYSAAGSTSCTACPEGTTNSAGDKFCGDLLAGYYGDVTAGTTAHTTATKCPAGTTRAAVSTVATGYKCTDIAANYYGTLGASTSVHATATECPAGTTSASNTYAGNSAGDEFYCNGIADGYYGIVGLGAAGGYHAVVTACPEGSTSDGTATTGTAGDLTTINDCTTKPGYYLSTAGLSNHVAGTITKAAAGYFAAGGVTIDSSGASVWSGGSTVQPGDYDSNAKVGKCPANSNSEAGATFCVCNAGYAPIYDTSLSGDASGTMVAAASTLDMTSTSAGSTVVAKCAPISGYVAAASPTAASPTADSAGASTPIAVALAAAAAVPLLL